MRPGLVSKTRCRRTQSTSNASQQQNSLPTRKLTGEIRYYGANATNLADRLRKHGFKESSKASITNKLARATMASMALFRKAKLLAGLHADERAKYGDLRRLRRHAPYLKGVTCRGKNDGGGAQLHAIMSAFAFCKAEGFQYIHTPICAVAHGEGTQWVSSWNNFVNFVDGIEQIPRNYPVPNLLEVFNLRRDPNMMLVANDHFHAYCDRRPFAYFEVQDEFRRRCATVKADVDEGVMAVHIRRGDVMTNSPQNARRRTPLERIGKIIDSMRKKRPDLVVKIFSQGHAAEFALIPADELHLDSDVFETMSALANAEVLLMAKSSFSYVAALLSRGTVIYEPFWHRPLPTWIKIDIGSL
jgi:hypothetical protein